MTRLTLWWRRLWRRHVCGEHPDQPLVRECVFMYSYHSGRFNKDVIYFVARDDAAAARALIEASKP